MLNSKPPSIFVVFAACITLAATTTAAEVQRWSVQLTDDTAVLRVSKNTEHKFVTATIASLQKAGRDKFALRVLESNDEADVTKSAYSIELTDGVAEVSATTDLPFNVLVSLINQLKDVGIARIKFVATNHSAGVPAASAQDDTPQRDATKTTSENVLGLLAESMQAQATDMVSKMIDGYLTYLGKPETTKKLATFQKNYYDALVEQGFTKEQAFELVLRFGNPLADGSPMKK